LILHWGGQQALCEHEDTQGAIVRKTLDRVISISCLV
jgi:hypothetical protein